MLLCLIAASWASGIPTRATASMGPTEVPSILCSPRTNAFIFLPRTSAGTCSGFLYFPLSKSAEVNMLVSNSWEHTVVVQREERETMISRTGVKVGERVDQVSHWWRDYRHSKHWLCCLFMVHSLASECWLRFASQREAGFHMGNGNKFTGFGSHGLLSWHPDCIQTAPEAASVFSPSLYRACCRCSSKH